MRNPNGYGSVVKLSGKRRNPYMVKITTGWTDDGKQIIKPIGYYKTKQEANIALAEYNKNPYDLDKSTTTLKDLWELFFNKKIQKLSKSNQHCLTSVYKNHAKPLYDKLYRDIRSYDIQDIIDNTNLSYATQSHIKSLFTHLDKLALETELIQVSYAVLLTTDKIPETNRTILTDEEIEKVKNNRQNLTYKVILLLLYTGMRSSELFKIENKDINLEERKLKGGLKTENGKNRIIPIHDYIFDIVQEFYNEDNKYLITNYTKQSFYLNFKKIFPNHTPHEMRHTFRSKLDSAGANQKCIDLLMGHKSKDVGNRVYTHKTLEELRKTINLLE
ncbi:MAG: site-specific integrase [Parvimonas sp.]|uniref:tyrosine-type recombinase/integrase n=1 Tax=Parvimonas sp. TaxID=1944660 RepID=UPI0025CF8D3E|nr:site-specific integrase [Parvimonas sp.]MCI5996715.1 site-specific integrase [Parvimonas sp.]